MLSLIITSTEIAFSFLKRSVPGLLIGIFIAELLIEKGIINKLSPVGKPFVKLSNLPEECALAFATAFLNTRAGNAMLIDFYREGKIGKKELYIASLMNAFPAMVRHWNSLIPVLLATLGTLGLLYFGILVLIGLSLIHISEPTRLGMSSYAVFRKRFCSFPSPFTGRNKCSIKCNDKQHSGLYSRCKPLKSRINK